MRHLLLLLFILFATTAGMSQSIRGVVIDTSGKPLAFATIKIGDTKQGLTADLNGKFKLKMDNIPFIIVTHLGYESQKIMFSNVDTSQLLRIILQPSTNMLEAVVVKSAYNKIRRILNQALDNRDQNNPDKYDWYQCNVYYKMLIDARPDSASAAKEMDSTELADIDAFSSSQHFFITETFSRRTWERPQKLQEEVLGTRISGFRKAWFTSLVTDVLPFHAYGDFINLNGKDYHNPLSSGLFQRFNFRLADEILQGSDTIWHISFEPKNNSEELSGSLFISSNGFAVNNFKAQHFESALKRLVIVEQQYNFENGKWFPQQLNYVVKWGNILGQPAELTMTGRSIIDSVTFLKDRKFRFDKAHTSKLVPGADELVENKWQQLRPVPLNSKEIKTYEVMDSLGKAQHFDRIVSATGTLIDGYLPLRKVDLDIQRIYSYNRYEKSRLGLGLRTNNRISKIFSVGGWFGYGFGDKSLKYGGFAEVFADKYREFKFRATYQNDLQDPGRLQIHTELDRSFLRRFLLGRVDKVKSYSFEVHKKFGYLSMVLGLGAENIIPQYDYVLVHANKVFRQFETNELSLSLRYAYAERMTPIFGKYVSNGSKYPIIYSKIRFGEVKENSNRYVHAVAAVKWRKRINRFGNEQFLLMGGGVFSKDPLPISKLFAGNGFRMDDQSFYVFGGMQTMLPYDYYTDKFINFYWQHDFDFRFYKASLTKNLSSSPMLSLGYNVLYGKLGNREVHKFVSFKVPDQGYHETGLMVNRVLRLRAMGMAYCNFNIGYYYHLNGGFDHKQNGRIVIGITGDL